MIELIVALFILILGVTSLVSLNITTVKTGAENKDQILASNLAREGVEIVRNIRDSNWLAGKNFAAGLSSGNDYTGTIFYTFAPVFEMVFTANSFEDDPLVSTPIYIYNNFFYQPYPLLFVGSEKTKFKRLITLDRICRNNTTDIETIRESGFSCDSATETLAGIRVYSDVQWTNTAGVIRTVRLEDKLYDWR